MSGRVRAPASDRPTRTPPAVTPDRMPSHVPPAGGPEAVADRLRSLPPLPRAEAVRALQRSRGNRWMEGLATGRPMPDTVRARMEGVFGADFSDVSVREDDAADHLDAAAFTRGSDIVFSRGMYDPHSTQGLAVLGHELAHVLQQRAGRVPGDGVTADPGLEAEADRAGERAARGEPVGALTTAGAGVAATGAPLQPKLRLPKFLRRSRSAAPAAAPQAAAEPAPYMTVELRPEPTEQLQQLTRQFHALQHQHNRTLDPVARADLSRQMTAVREAIGDAYDEHSGVPGVGRRQREERAAAPAASGPGVWGVGGGGAHLYQRSPGDDPCGPGGAYASPHLNDYASPHLPENPYASPHLPESPYASPHLPESPYANIPQQIAESPYANIPPEILARRPAAPAKKAARKAGPPRPTPFIPSYRRRG